jgi:hypothetical protein
MHFVSNLVKPESSRQSISPSAVNSRNRLNKVPISPSNSCCLSDSSSRPLQLELRQRHEYAIALARDSFSEMRGAGQPTWVAKQMGHADWTMIARV